MKNILKNKIAKLVDSRKYDWIWDKISNTYFGYYVRKILMSIMGINEDFAIRDIVAEGDEIILKMTHPDDYKSRFNLLLVQLPLPSNRRHKRILPMGLAYMAAFLREKLPDVNIGILDAQCQNMSFTQVLEKIKEIDWNVVGISYWSVQAKFASNLSRKIKESNKNTTIIHGGVHTTVLPDEALQTADFAVLSEGEETLTELISSLKEKKGFKEIKGIAYREGKKTIVNEIRPLIPNLDDIPLPAFDLLPVEKYKMPLHVVGGDRLPLMGSRGCPYACSFCTSPILWQKKVRWRSAKRVVDEIQLLEKKYNVRKFHFWDDNFTLNPRFVKELCSEIESRDLNVEWIALDRAEHINRNKDLLRIMKKAGCIGIELGLESANPDTFAHISKEQGIEDSRNAIVNLKANNIYPLYTCMVFNPGESIAGYYMQKEFLDKAQEDYPWHSFFHPFPYPVYIGQFATPYQRTEFFENIEKESLILLEDVEDRYHHQINSIPYSLLNDIPIRIVEELDEELYMLFLNAVKIGFWTYFPGNDSKKALGEKLDEVYKFILPFFNYCDGKMSVHQIGLKLADDLNLTFFKAMRMTAYATYIYAQVGAIRSALHYTDYEINRKHIQIPLAIRKDILSILKQKKILKNSFVSPIKL